MAEPFINLKTKEHKQQKERKGQRGTLDYCSINSHLESSLSRRDDLESLAYCFMFLWKGKLPLSNKGFNSFKKESILNLKIELSTYGYSSKNIPKNLSKFLDYSTKLKFDEIPDYKYLKKLIREL